MSEYPSPLCRFCKHYKKKLPPGRPFTCDAFPDGIPDKIYFEVGDHRKPIKGDHHIRFEKRRFLSMSDRWYLKRLLAMLDSGR